MTSAISSDLSHAITRTGPPGFFELKSRIGRAQFLVFIFAASIPVMMVLMSQGASALSGTPELLIANAVTNAVTLFAGSRRLADMEVSRWACVTLVLPLIGIVATVWMAAAKGSEGQNRYGEAPVSYSGMSSAAILLGVFLVGCCVYIGANC